MKKKVCMVSDELSQAIEDFRFKERFKNESDAIRYLLAKGLDVCVNLPQPEEKDEENQNVE